MPSSAGLGIVAQVRAALRARARLATLIGFLLGGFVPLATYTLAHAPAVADTRAQIWTLIGGGLIFSAKTVYEWAKLAFESALKSVGFCVLAEGVMVLGQTHWLAVTALVYLIVINGVATGCRLSLAPRKARL